MALRNLLFLLFLENMETSVSSFVVLLYFINTDALFSILHLTLVCNLRVIFAKQFFIIIRFRNGIFLIVSSNYFLISVLKFNFFFLSRVMSIVFSVSLGRTS